MKTKIKSIPDEIRELESVSLRSLIKELDDLGIKKKDYDKLTFEADFGYCYYEGDPIGVKLNINIKK